MRIQIEKAQDVAGFAASNARQGDPVSILQRSAVTSDEPAFYKYVDHIASVFLAQTGIPVSGIVQFLIVIHQDLTADVLVNDFPVVMRIRMKRDVKKGQPVSLADIADIERVTFPDISLAESDKILYCFKVGWRFGLFFDLTVAGPTEGNVLDIEGVERGIGGLYRYLSFYDVYKSLEPGGQFASLMQDGWFPFIEIVAKEYKELVGIYESGFDVENRIAAITESFDGPRIERITSKWWKNQHFREKQPLIEAGVAAYLSNSPGGFISGIKTLWSETEGVLRSIYYEETGKGSRVQSSEFITHLAERAKSRTDSEGSLFLPLEFTAYLRDVGFSSFDVEAGNIGLSRHTTAHGVAAADQYTRARALQLILVLDQIYFYGSARP